MASTTRRLRREGKSVSMKTLDFRSCPRRPGQNGKPGDIAIRAMDANDRPFVDDLGQPIWFVLREFLLARTGDESFTQGLQPIEAMELQLETRKAIKAQCSVDDGLFVFEDAQATRLAKAILHPAQGYMAASAPCLYPYLLPAQKMIDGDARAASAPGQAVEVPSN